MKKILPILAFGVISSAAQAGCLNWQDTPPAIPSGNMATLQEMYKVQEQVKDYIKEGIGELECTSSDMKYNYILYRLKKVAKNYNQELRSFNYKVAQR